MQREKNSWRNLMPKRKSSLLKFKQNSESFMPLSWFFASLCLLESFSLAAFSVISVWVSRLAKFDRWTSWPHCRECRECSASDNGHIVMRNDEYHESAHIYNGRGVMTLWLSAGGDEGRGIGLVEKIRAYELQEIGHVTTTLGTLGTLATLATLATAVAWSCSSH